jgi:hypothetical protein
MQPAANAPIARRRPAPPELAAPVDPLRAGHAALAELRLTIQDRQTP